MKTLYVSDLDGTLLRYDESVSRFSVETINDLVDSGLAFTYATARSISSASIVTKGIEWKIPVVTHNGVFGIDAKTGKIIFKNSFDPDVVAGISRFLIEQRVYPLVYSFIDGAERVSWLSGKENKGIRRYLNNRRGDRRLREAADEKTLYSGDIFYFTCIGEHDELLPVFEKYSKNGPYNSIFHRDIYSTEYWWEIMPKNATKANAVLQLKNVLGFDRIVCFGDGHNDIPMFEIADECYAVSNAVPDLQKMATGVIDANENDAVAKWLFENFSVG